MTTNECSFTGPQGCFAFMVLHMSLEKKTQKLFTGTIQFYVNQNSFAKCDPKNVPGNNRVTTSTHSNQRVEISKATKVVVLANQSLSLSYIFLYVHVPLY